MIKEIEWYHRRGFSMIPVNPTTKKPYIKWQKYQKEKASLQQLKDWIKKFPGCGIGIVTGAISGLTIIDVDTEEGKKEFEGYLSDSFLTPVVKSPHGWHYYFTHTEGLVNRARVLTGCDVRNDGGYIVAPPSSNGKGSYTWLPGCKIGKTDLASIPDALKEKINANNKNKIRSISSSIGAEQIVTERNASVTERNILIKGSRDDDLFHLAHHLVKGGMPTPNIRKYLHFFASKCEPPFPTEDIETKIQSAIKREEDHSRSIAQEIREWVSVTEGIFSVTEMRHDVTMRNAKEKTNGRVVLSRMVKEGIIERYGNKNGMFRKIQKDNPKIDIMNVDTDFLEIKYPLKIEDYFRTMPSNIIIVAGTQDAGKTAFMMSIAKLNMNRGMPIVYQSSEMGALELRSRIDNYQDITPDAWAKGVDFHELIGLPQDSIEPDAINIIDYLEISDNFFQIAGTLKQIKERLKGGIAVVGLQMDDNAEYGRGASFSKEKPRLYLTLKSDPPQGTICTIKKCKNWRSSLVNPNHLECIFRIRNGCDIRQATEWKKPWDG